MSNEEEVAIPVRLKISVRSRNGHEGFRKQEAARLARVREASGGKEKGISFERIKKMPLLWHRRFDVEVWGNESRASFHNELHIKALLEANQKLFDKVEESDPLEIKGNLSRWNESNPDVPLTLEELREAVEFALLEHDDGNIKKDLERRPNGFKPVYLDTYRAGTTKDEPLVDAEDRSIRTSTLLIESSDLPEDKKKKFLRIVPHLIKSTRFWFREEGEKSEPFAVYMRIVDQIGGNLFSKNGHLVSGLLEEKMAENPNSSDNLYNYVNFTYFAFDRLVPDDVVQEGLIRVWGKAKPDLDNSVANEIRPLRVCLAEAKRLGI